MAIPFDGERRRVLITGAGGFVGPYVVKALRQACHENLEIVATTNELRIANSAERSEILDVTDEPAVRGAIAHYEPSHVIHLAGLAAPVASSINRRKAWRLHVGGAINIAQAILDQAPHCCLIHVGSGLAYGYSAKSGLPIDETALLAPIDDYAVTKAAADLAVGAFSHRGVHIIRLRPFNHTGPGQTDAFVIPAFAAQVARIELGLSPPVIYTGNLDPERDFLDVRDVADAYALTVLKSQSIESNAIFNIASGAPRRVADVLDWFLQHSTKNIIIEKDKSRLRQTDLPRIVGNAGRARQALGWIPKKRFDETLNDILFDWRRRLSSDQMSSQLGGG